MRRQNKKAYKYLLFMVVTYYFALKSFLLRSPDTSVNTPCSCDSGTLTSGVHTLLPWGSTHFYLGGPHTLTLRSTHFYLGGSTNSFLGGPQTLTLMSTHSYLDVRTLLPWGLHNLISRTTHSYLEIHTFTLRSTHSYLEVHTLLPWGQHSYLEEV